MLTKHVSEIHYVKQQEPSGTLPYAAASFVPEQSQCLQAMICVEWWCFEAIILLAGRLLQPEVAIDIVGICVNIATTTFMFPFGLAGELQIFLEYW